MNKKRYIIISSILICFLMFVVEKYIQPIYFYKSIIKAILFGGIVISFSCINKEKLIGKQLKVKIIEIKKSICLAISVYIIILAAYFFFSKYIDVEAIKMSLLNKENITKDNFVLVSLYITLINSFLEEVFFRGYIFYGLKSLGMSKFSYAFSSMLFAIYHVAIISAWFSPVIFALIMIALFCAGVIFDALAKYYDSFKASWLVHMAANLGINTIGFIIFNII